MLELFRQFPGLAESLPHVALGSWPTPAYRLERLSGQSNIFIKNDGYCGPLYGGNKIRKLEFLLAQAIAQGHKEVMTFGVAGSNHALATELYAEKLGLRCVSILTSQTNSRYVAKNLLAGLSTNAELHHFDSETAALQSVKAISLQHKQSAGIEPMLIPGGGSSAAGTVGFVNAAFELARQIEEKIIPPPDKLYVALGTMGTAAGLQLGIRACGLAIELVPVRVVRDSIANVAAMEKLYNETNRLLHRCDTAFPLIPFAAPVIRHDQFGERYAIFTKEGMAAKRLLAEKEGLSLEGTYTAKTIAALLEDLQNGSLDGKNALYWHTYNLQPVPDTGDYKKLPPGFHRYFESPVQELDTD
ncbi:MAG: pyridoxal-phosphate dependent enzyme [Gammaproteobacteria bacterium]|nr:pyridoxal-phosphate dependent enzyme [Gammaproteobacteria bacterium]